MLLCRTVLTATCDGGCGAALCVWGPTPAQARAVHATSGWTPKSPDATTICPACSAIYWQARAERAYAAVVTVTGGS